MYRNSQLYLYNFSFRINSNEQSHKLSYQDTSVQKPHIKYLIQNAIICIKFAKITACWYMLSFLNSFILSQLHTS